MLSDSETTLTEIGIRSNKTQGRITRQDRLRQQFAIDEIRFKKTSSKNKFDGENCSRCFNDVNPVLDIYPTIITHIMAGVFFAINFSLWIILIVIEDAVGLLRNLQNDAILVATVLVLNTFFSVFAPYMYNIGGKKIKRCPACNFNLGEVIVADEEDEKEKDEDEEKPSDNGTTEKVS